jgi:hypothetical protein
VSREKQQSGGKTGNNYSDTGVESFFGVTTLPELTPVGSARKLWLPSMATEKQLWAARKNKREPGPLWQPRAIEEFVHHAY